MKLIKFELNHCENSGQNCENNTRNTTPLLHFRVNLASEVVKRVSGGEGRGVVLQRLNSIFLTLADKVSYGMGTPANIIIWILAVAAWIGFGPVIAKSNFLPDWFTSNAFNFPLNTVTTLAELYIGFLVAAAANRTERENRRMIEDIKHMTEQQDVMLEKLIANQTKEIAEEEQILEKIK